MKKILAAVTLAVSLATFAYAAEPAKAPAAPGSPAAVACAAGGQAGPALGVRLAQRVWVSGQAYDLPAIRIVE